MKTWISICGWLTMVCRIRQAAWAGCCLLGMLPTVQAAEDSQAGAGSQELPDLALLEFLGSFETDEGEWIDPDSLLSTEFGNLLNAASNSADEDGDAQSEDSSNAADQGRDDEN